MYGKNAGADCAQCEAMNIAGEMISYETEYFNKRIRKQFPQRRIYLCSKLCIRTFAYKFATIKGLSIINQLTLYDI